MTFMFRYDESGVRDNQRSPLETSGSRTSSGDTGVVAQIAQMYGSR